MKTKSPLLLDESELKVEEKEGKEGTKKMKIATQICLFAPIFFLLILIFTIFLGLRLDNKIESWATTFVPNWLFFITFALFLTVRWIFCWMKIKMKDSFDSPKILLLISSFIVAIGWFNSITFAKINAQAPLGWEVAFFPVHLFFVFLSILSFFSFLKSKDWTEKSISILLSTLFLTLFSLFICIDLKLQNIILSSWGIVLIPLWILFALPFIGSFLACLLVYWKKERMNCSKLFDCGREDNAEGFLFTLVGILSALIIFPFFIVAIMLVNILNGSTAKTFSSSFVPLEILEFGALLCSLYFLFKRYKSIK